MERAEIHGTDSADILRAGLDGAARDVLLVNPTENTMEALLGELEQAHSTPTVRLFADRRPYKALIEDFLLATAMAELRDAGSLEIRELTSVPRHSLLLTGERAVTILDCDGRVAGLQTTAEPFVRAARDTYEERWERAEPFPLRTPPLSRIRETLAADIGPTARADFDRAIEMLETGRGNGEGLDEVTISLLVAAKNGELLYDISRWGEDVRLASKATFSRTKNELEEEGLIETEKVPIDVGRPRLRLRPGASHLREADIEDLVDHVRAELG